MWSLILGSCTKYVRMFKNKYIVRVYNLCLQVNIDIDTADTKRLVENPYTVNQFLGTAMYFSIIAYMHIYIYITLSLYAFLPWFLHHHHLITVHLFFGPWPRNLRCQPTDCQPTATGIYAGVTILEVEVGGEVASKNLPSQNPSEFHVRFWSWKWEVVWFG